MPLIQTPAIARKLQRFLRLTELPDSVLAPETVPVILVEDLSAPLTDIDRGCMGATNAAGVAGELGLISLVRVGAPASYDLRVTEFHFAVASSMLVTLDVPTVPVVGLTPTTSTTFTDFNLPGRPTSQLGIDTVGVLPASRILYEIEALSNTTYRLPLDIQMGTIGQGSDLTTLLIVARTTNIALRGGFKWTESDPRG